MKTLPVAARGPLAASLAGALGVCLVALAPPARAQEPVGFVKTLSGTATITTAGTTHTAQVGSSVYQGSEIHTGVGASMGVTFLDSTLMSFGPDTTLTVDEYLYQPAQDALRFDSRLTRGTLNYVSGAIAKRRPSAVQIKTPSGTIGVRGTHFVAKIEDD